MSKIKRKSLSIEEKVMILKVYDEKSQTKKQTQLAAELHLPVSTLRTIVKKRGEINEERCLGGVKRKKQKVGKFNKLENVLVNWFHQARALKQPINGRILCEKAREIAVSLDITDFTASNGWINRFKNRYGIIYNQFSEDSEMATENPQIDEGAKLETVEPIEYSYLQIGEKSQTEVEQDVDLWMTTLQRLLKNYEPQDIFNADEFGLFYKLMPDNYYIYKSAPCHDHAEESNRTLTVLACANSDGSEKLRLLIIGKEKTTHCLNNVRSLPVTYDEESQARMTGRRFLDWLRILDGYFHMKGRRIILFIDDCPAHPKDNKLNNIKLVFIPPNETQRQPMVQGIINVVKQGYRTRLIHRYLNRDDPDSRRPLHLHDAILNIAAAWDAIRPETIQNSFEKAGFRNDRNRELNESAQFTILQDFPGYSSIDDNVETCEVSSIQSLIGDANNTKETVNHNQDALKQEETSSMMSDAQALSAVADLRRYMSFISNSEDVITKLNYIENVALSNKIE